jgi:hypothetical protein
MFERTALVAPGLHVVCTGYRRCVISIGA